MISDALIKTAAYVEAEGLFVDCKAAYNLFLVAPINSFVLDDIELDLVLVSMRKVKDQLHDYFDKDRCPVASIETESLRQIRVVLERLELYADDLLVNIL